MSTENHKDVEQIIKDDYLDTLPELVSEDIDRKILKAAETAMDQAQQNRSTDRRLNIWSIIMDSRMIKLTTAAIVVLGICIGTGIFIFSGSGLAFAKVAETIRETSYTFDLIVDWAGDTPLLVKVQEPGLMRLDTPTGVGDISCILDSPQQKTLILMHAQKAAILKKLGPETYQGDMGVFALCMESINELWALRDGSEKELEKQRIEGVMCQGFAVVQDDEYARDKITVWAAVENARPVRVEINTTVKQDNNTFNWVLVNFQLDMQLDRGLFSFKPPEGYTLAYEKKLEELPNSGEQTNQADKIMDILETIRSGNMDAALEKLLEIDWDQPIEFADDVYVFTLTEQDFVSLVPADQNRVMEIAMADSKLIRDMSKALEVRIRQAGGKNDVNQAESYIRAGLEMGKLLSRNPEGMLVIRLVGMAIQKLILNSAIDFYEDINQLDKRQTAQSELDKLHAETNAIKAKARGQ